MWSSCVLSRAMCSARVVLVNVFCATKFSLDVQYLMRILILKFWISLYSQHPKYLNSHTLLLVGGYMDASYHKPSGTPYAIWPIFIPSAMFLASSLRYYSMLYTASKEWINRHCLDHEGTGHFGIQEIVCIRGRRYEHAFLPRNYVLPAMTKYHKCAHFQI